MKISQLDNDIYEIENVLSADDWKKVYAEFNPVYNNWIFKKKEFDQLPITERSSQTALFPTWGNIAKLVNDDGIGEQLDEFTQFQIKIVMQGTDAANPPRIKDLRAIALAT